MELKKRKFHRVNRSHMVTLKRVRFKVYFHCSHSIERKILQDSLSFEHPDPYNVPSYNERKSNGDRKWDGIIRMYAIDDSFHIGMLKYVKQAFKKHNIAITYKNFEVSGFSDIKFSDSIQVEERDYQRAAIIKCLQEKIGTVQVPTRGGKTYIAGEKMRILLELSPERNVLFITDSTDALKQLPSDLMPFVDKFCNKIGVIEGEQRDFTEKVTIGMVQTIQGCLRRSEKKQTIKDKEMLKYLSTINVLMIDEIHEHMSDARIDLIKWIVWRKKSIVEYFWQYSATTWKKSDISASLRLEKYTGGIIFDITQKELQERKVIAENKILLIINDIDIDEILEEDYRELQKALIYESKTRNNLLCIIIDLCTEMQLKTLVMFSSKVHGYKISEATGIRFLSGDDNIFERKMVKDAWLQEKGGTLLVSEIWKKAITLPEVEVFVNADGGKEDTLIIQKKGRVLGVTKDKTKALIIDIIDICEEFFSEHSMSRIEAYEVTNLPETIDTMDYDENTYNNLKRYLQEWFDEV